MALMDRSSKQKITKEIQASNDTLDHLDLVDIYRALHPKTMDFTIFSSAHGTFSRIYHILDHKSSLSGKCPQERRMGGSQAELQYYLKCSISKENIEIRNK